MTSRTDDPIAVLERELVEAAQRRASMRQAPTNHEPPRTARRADHRLRTTAALAAVVIPVLAVAAALALTAGRSPRVAPAADGSGQPGLRLRDELAVLRRPQRPSDLTDSVRGTAARVIVRALLRRLRDPVPGGRLELIVSHRTTGNAPLLLGAYATYAGTVASSSGAPAGATSAVMGFTSDLTAAQFATQGLPVQVGPHTLAIVVPDGVGEVSLGGARVPRLAVRANVAILDASPSPVRAQLAHATMSWYGPTGRFIRTAGPLPRLASPPLATSRTATAPADLADALPPILGVLRRPQTGADRSLPELHGHPSFDLGLGTPQPELARLATTTSWGARIFLVPFITPTGAGPVLDLFGPGPGGPGGTGSPLVGFSRADIETGRAVVVKAVADPVPGLRFVIVVPDGVAQAKVSGPPVHAGTSPGQLVGVTAVHGNIAAIQMTGLSPGRRVTIEWVNARGRVTRHFSLLGGGR